MYQMLEWDSNFFGFKIARLNDQVQNKDLLDTVDLLKKRGVTLVIAVTSPNDSSRIKTLESAGFSLVEVRMILKADLKASPAYSESLKCFVATHRHIPSLLQCSKGLFESTRFSCPPFVPGQDDKLYETWIEHAVNGQFDDFCLCLPDQDKIAAFCSLKEMAQSTMRIGLFGVGKAYQGRKLSRVIMNDVIAYCTSAGAKNLLVATQAWNTKALNVYVGSGFCFNAVEIWHYLTFRRKYD